MNKRKIGAEQELRARVFLETNGYKILETNYRCIMGEVDIIAKDGDYLCFIEVKYRSTDRMGDPLEAVDMRKMRKICRAASYYAVQKAANMNSPMRFDVVGILDNDIKLVRNAFEYTV